MYHDTPKASEAIDSRCLTMIVITKYKAPLHVIDAFGRKCSGNYQEHQDLVRHMKTCHSYSLNHSKNTTLTQHSSKLRLLYR
jgi:hypothetical protein